MSYNFIFFIKFRHETVPNAAGAYSVSRRYLTEWNPIFISGFCTWENIICVAANNGTNDFFTRKGWVRSISDSAHRITTTTTRPHTQPQDGIYSQKWQYLMGVKGNRWRIRNLCSQNTRRKTSSHYIYQSHVCLDIINEQWSSNINSTHLFKHFRSWTGFNTLWIFIVCCIIHGD